MEKGKILHHSRSLQRAAASVLLVMAVMTLFTACSQKEAPPSSAAAGTESTAAEVTESTAAEVAAQGTQIGAAGAAAQTASEANAGSSAGEKISMKNYEGVWYSEDKAFKLTIRDGELTQSFKGKDGNYTGVEVCKVKVDSKGDLVNADGSSNIAMCWRFRLEGGLLIGDAAVLDSNGMSMKFARSGDESLFPRYPKAPSEIGTKKIKKLSFSAGQFEQVTSLKEHEKLNDSGSFEIVLTPSDSDASYICTLYTDIDERHFRLSEDRMEQIVALLLSNEVLTVNPYKDSNGMSRPFDTMELEVSFESGEQISVYCRHGFEISEKLMLELFELLTGGEEADADTSGATAAETAAEWVCAKCGTGNSSKFCRECGSPKA